ncbi:MAG: hypothetical protein AAGA12_05835 [Pseudomonadota bacterium]
MKKLVLATATTLMIGSVASATTLETVNSDIGPVMASAKSGLTLYTFRNDAQNTSNCYGDCANAWPPFAAKANAKGSDGMSVIKRKDGSHQWALNGKPLYFWAGDAERGDATGDGVGGVWDAVRK